MVRKDRLAIFRSILLQRAMQRKPKAPEALSAEQMTKAVADGFKEGVADLLTEDGSALKTHNEGIQQRIN